jgi:hypothetical protein
MSGNPEQQLHDEANDLVGHRKNNAAMTTKIKTMLVVIMVSRRVGQVTLATSARTSRTNSIGFFVMLTVLKKWQEWRDSNPRPSVLETDALPTELHSYGAPL